MKTRPSSYRILCIENPFTDHNRGRKTHTFVRQFSTLSELAKYMVDNQKSVLISTRSLSFREKEILLSKYLSITKN